MMQKQSAKTSRFAFWPELLVLTIFILAVMFYVFYAKTAVKKVPIYLQMQLLSERREEILLKNTLSLLETGAKDQSGRIKLSKLVYFSTQRKDWLFGDDYVKARANLTCLADQRDGVYYFGDQEIVVGKELLLKIDNHTLFGRVSKIQTEPIEEDLHEKKIKVRFQDVRSEYLTFFDQVKEIKDHQGFVYAWVTKVSKMHSPKAVTTSTGQVLARYEPYYYDIDWELTILSDANLGANFAYDGTKLSLDEIFIVNDDLLKNFIGRIVAID